MSRWNGDGFRFKKKVLENNLKKNIERPQNETSNFIPLDNNKK